MLLIFTVSYLLINVVVGLWASSKVKNTADFALAGRNLSVLVAGVSIFATWFGSETIMSSSGEFAKGGILAVIKEPFGPALCLLLIGLFFARPLYRLNIVTFSDYFRLRFGRTAELVSALFMSYSYLSWIAGQFKAMGGIMHTMTENYGSYAISVETGIIIGAVIIALYTCVGGMWAVSYTDFIQTIVILTGLFILTFSLLWAAGGFMPIYNAQPEGFFHVIPQSGTAYENPQLGNWWIYIAAWITIGLGSIPQQDVFQRTMSTRSENSAARSAYLSAGMYVTIAFFPLFIGMAGRYLYPHLFTAGDTEGLLLNVLKAHSGVWLQILFYGALTSAIMSTASGAILAPATIVTENLIRPLFPKLTNKRMLAVLRITVLVVTILAVISALGGSSIYDLNAVSATITLVSLFVPLAFGVFWKRMSGIAALGSMVVGFTAWLIADFYIDKDAVDIIPSLFFGLFASIGSAILLALIFPNTMDEPQPMSLEIGSDDRDIDLATDAHLINHK
jgi:solute:Na+ symporter, SSS family